MLTCELVNQTCCVFFFRVNSCGSIFCSYFSSVWQYAPQQFYACMFFHLFFVLFWTRACLSCVCIIHIETCCDIVVFFLKIDRNRRRFDNECNEKLLCTRQEKQSVTIRGKIKSSACRSTVCEIQHKNE